MTCFKLLYQIEQLPVFQNMIYCTPEEARNCAKGDVVLVQDQDTGLIFNQSFNPDLMAYDNNYQNEQANSEFFRNHLHDISRIIEKHFLNQTLIEVGCGKGFFLELLTSMGFKITGYDPAYEGTNPNVIKAYYNKESGLQAHGIILRHVLEHIQNPVKFLAQLRDSNSGIGKIFIEVPCFDWICQHRAWFDIFYEHVNYFRIRDLINIFGEVYDYGPLFGGQYFYVVADLASLKSPIFNQDSFQFPEDFLISATYYTETLRHHKSNYEDNRKTVIWGGSSKGVIFSLFMQRAGITIDMAIDINPAKQHKYMAASGLKIYPPEEATSQLPPGSDIIIMNSNYLEEIKIYTNNQFNYLTVDHE